MKTIFNFLSLIIAVALWQGCESKERQAKYAAIDKASAEASDAQRAEVRAAKKQSLAKASAEKEEQRKIAFLEKCKVSVTYKDAAGRIVYNKAEVDPSFSGGTAEMRKFLQDNLQYPASAKDKGLEGTVYVDFVVDEKGRVREVMATDVVGEDVDLSLKEESVRVVAAMPLWKPGTQHGKAVDASFSIPITFELSM
jgi:TonB family protein